MKKLSIILIVLLSSLLIASDKQPKKFKVTYSITFNEVTLEKAAQIEKEISKQFGESCEIKIELSAIKDVEEFSRYYFVPDSFKIDTMNFY